MLKIVQTYKLNKKLSALKREYQEKCDTLACFKYALPMANRRMNQKLAFALRDEITNLNAECQELNGKINHVVSELRRIREHNSIFVT